MLNCKNVIGLLNLNKPSGITSRAAVNHINRILRKVKAGHAGTLDPLASGVLVVCLGPATRLIESVQAMDKVYRVRIRLGATSDSLDADGEIVEHPDPPVPTLEAIEQALIAQTGTIEQLPPAYSALKVGGVRAYELARAGQTVELAPRPVTIHRISVLHYDWPFLDLEVTCEGGTYIRSIARDLGETLGCGGLVEVLVRTRIGPFDLESAVEPEALTPDSLADWIRPALEAVPDLPRIVLSADQMAEIALGRAIRVESPSLAETDPQPRVALVDAAGSLVGIGDWISETGKVQPRKVFVV